MDFKKGSGWKGEGEVMKGGWVSRNEDGTGNRIGARVERTEGRPIRWEAVKLAIHVRRFGRSASANRTQRAAA